MTRRRARGHPRGQLPGWLWLVAGYLFLTRWSAGLGAGGIIPQPYAYWWNPETHTLFLAGADGFPPGAAPPWRLASEAEIAASVGP